ncbi:hypothetical protein IMZ31_09880 [Pontibacillus sp. ALD_SL1]|uniref:hypothetical protein n=1 Tax=Pontibacillus sp. ALD_SL1 TaxID=2777185 RepID=UPI001A961FB3|nr:hypothetical protein [Pontibacillus sp. ALD_SL1]QSS98426.1 hypothetical protein IMZ31_09880 [Pontibacillus sp. ALD_SL1]
MRAGLILLNLILQITGLVRLLIDVKTGIILYISSYVPVGIVLFMLVKDRQKEKEEEERNDYRDY